VDSALDQHRRPDRALPRQAPHGKHRTAALLLVPYLAWVTFAAALNTSIWLLNP